MIRVTKEFHFCAAHRLENYNGKCASLHGHNYRVLLTLGGKINAGMVQDFGDIAKRFAVCIDGMDHAFIISEQDKILFPAIEELCQRGIVGKVFVMPEKITAENLATYLFNQAVILFEMSWLVFVHSVTVYETDTCFATVER